MDSGTFSEVIWRKIEAPFEVQTNASVDTSKGRAPTPTCVSLAGPPSLAQERDLKGYYTLCMLPPQDKTFISPTVGIDMKEHTHQST